MTIFANRFANIRVVLHRLLWREPISVSGDRQSWSSSKSQPLLAPMRALSRVLKQALNRLLLPLATAIVINTPALATVYAFTSTDIPGFGPSPTTSSFSLDTAAATIVSDGSQFNNVALTYDGMLYPDSSISTQFGTNLASSLFFFIDTSVRPFYTGTGTATVFNTGTFTIADGATDGEGTLSISAKPVSAVPEITTWTMMLIGFGAIGVTSRQRWLKTARG